MHSSTASARSGWAESHIMHLEMTQGSTFVSNMNHRATDKQSISDCFSLGLGFRLRKIMTRENVRNDAEYAFSCTHTQKQQTKTYTLKVHKGLMFCFFPSSLFFFISLSPSSSVLLFTRSQIYYEEKWCCWQAGEQGSQKKPEVCWGEWRVKSSF